ncbi:MAG: hypothetical protein AB1861_27680 [Cyanobacteriota bacterium]
MWYLLRGAITLCFGGAIATCTSIALSFHESLFPKVILITNECWVRSFYPTYRREAIAYGTLRDMPDRAREALARFLL